MLANFGAYEPTNSFATCTWDTGSTTLVSHMTRPRLDQRTLHREVFIRRQSRIAGLLQHGLKQILGNLTLQQPVPILREHGHIPDAVIHLKTHGPTNQRNSETASCTQAAPSTSVHCESNTEPGAAERARAARVQLKDNPCAITTCEAFDPTEPTPGSSSLASPAMDGRLESAPPETRTSTS